MAGSIGYRKNFRLIIIFMVLISVLLIIALTVGFNFTKKYVENEFSSLKIEVLEETIEPYNNLFQNKIPEVSFYQGFLDSLSALKYANAVLAKYKFVEKIYFYDAEISNHYFNEGIKIGNLNLGVRSFYSYNRNLPGKSSLIFDDGDLPGNLSTYDREEFRKIGRKFEKFLIKADTTKLLTSDLIFKTFYNVGSNKISYLNVPRREEIKLYKDLMMKTSSRSPVYEQDFFTFELNPYKLTIKNIHKNLYQFINIRPISYDPILERPNLATTDIILPGAFSDYKLYFSSETEYLEKEVTRRFLPIGLAFFTIYLVLAFITFLIYRNLYINQRLYKLQYDFINNLTHEFKTPVAVIKIAGNNIKRAKILSDREKNHYGKILDEEADKLNDLMNKLLSFTQIENKAIKLKQEDINLEVFSQNIIDKFQFKHPDYDIELSIKNLEIFSTDPILLSSLFHNLIDNAYKYSVKGSKKLKISIYKQKKNIVFSFRDYGIGIEKSEFSNIFKKFYRIQNQYNQQGSVGLGLAFCKELVHFMNGQITIKSKPGVGSTFHVILPYNK